MTITHDLVITAEQQDGYLTVPFEVPAGTARIEVQYSYTGLGPGECVLDLGCMEGNRFRGWTGGARSHFFVEAGRATPGYAPGPITPGPWAVALGAYRVPPAGMTCHVEIRLIPHRRRWLRGDLHHHTHHSDGAHSVAEVMRMAEAAGLDFLALTDHNTLTQNRIVCESDVAAIPGIEITTNHGHLNILGAPQTLDFDFRFRSAREGLAGPLQAVREAGGLAMLNHPHCDVCPWEWEWDLPFDLAEVWNGIWTGRNERALAWWQAELAAGRRIPAVGGSDTHQVGLFSVIRTGTPTTYTHADDLTVPAILAALKAGHTMISDCPDGPVIWLTADGKGPGEAVPPGLHRVQLHVERAEQCCLRLIGPAGVLAPDLAPDQPDCTLEYAWQAEPGSFLRAELRSLITGGLRAMTNPIWVG